MSEEDANYRRGYAKGYAAGCRVEAKRAEVGATVRIVELARQLVRYANYTTVAKAGPGAGVGNHLRDALDALDELLPSGPSE